MIFDIPKNNKSIIKVIGVGGGGSNAVNHMFKEGIVGVDFAICNTDNQALDMSAVPTKIQLGPLLTEGRGAGSIPQVGKQACLESIEDLRTYLDAGTKMLFVTAGMGGGTGTGAAPIVAKLAREMGILTVGIVTLPFVFEGKKRNMQGMEGLEELRNNVDTLIIISNNKLREIYGSLTLSKAFGNADDVLTTAAKSIAEIITVPGLVNVDFADVDFVMRNSGVAVMGTATAEGEDRAIRAADEALNSPLLEESNIRGAQKILLNVTSGNQEVTMDELFEITGFIQEEAGDADLIFGTCHDESLGDKICVTVIATGFDITRGMHKLVDPAVNTAHGPARVWLDDEEKKTPSSTTNHNKRPLYELDRSEAAKTVSFDLSTSHYEKFQKNQYSSQEPYIRDANTQAPQEDNRQRTLLMASARREQQRATNVKMTQPNNLVEMENVPAYMRRNIRLDDVPHSSEMPISRWTISEDEEPEMRANNSFLHDNVD